MDLLKHIRLLAQYNEWMNAKVYEAAAQVAPDQLAQDRGAFFGSVLGTLNHIMVGDIIWLKRLGTHPAGHRSLEPVRQLERPASLDQIIHRDLGGLREQRGKLDAIIVAWAAELSAADLDHVLEYRNMKGVPMRKLFGSLVLNLFNHQTHHRGQATTLLSQAGLDVGVTDLLALIPEEPGAARTGSGHRMMLPDPAEKQPSPLRQVVIDCVTPAGSGPLGSRSAQSPLHAHHLLQGVHDLDQVGLVGHHGVDVLVGARDLVDHAAVLAAFDARGLRGQVGSG